MSRPSERSPARPSAPPPAARNCGPRHDRRPPRCAARSRVPPLVCSRPAVEEVEAAAAAVLASADAGEEARLAEIARDEAAARARAPAQGVPPELFDVLWEARRNSVRLRALQQRKEAVHVVELERRFKLFDDLIQRASRVVSPGDGDGGATTSGGGAGGAGGAVVDHEVVEIEAMRNPALAAAVAAAATEIDRGGKGGLGLEPKSVSSLRRATSAGS